MPGFTVTATAAAPVEDVWKILFDPTRIPEWWTGLEAVRVDGSDAFTLWFPGASDRPLPQRVRAEHAAARITMSCQVNEVDFTWQPADDGGDGTLITVVVTPASTTGDLSGAHASSWRHRCRRSRRWPRREQRSADAVTV